MSTAVDLTREKESKNMDMFDKTKVFSVIDASGVNTMAFQINTTFEEGTPIFSLEKLKSFMELVDGGFKKTFFFNPEPESNERKIVVFLTIKPGEAVLNSGEFVNGNITVGKKPGHIKYSSLKLTGDESEYKEFEYLPNFKRNISIIDPILGDEVRPVVFLDADSNKMKAKIKLLPHKSSIALEIG
jgi:hypothetical protein